MRNAFKSLIFLVTCLVANIVSATTIYQTDFVASPTGATTESNKGEFTTAPTWASGYTNCFHTTGSAGAVTLTFSPAIDLTGYTNCKLTLYWGAESNRPVSLSVNGGSSTQIDAVGSSADRSKVRTISTDLSVTSITSLKFNGSGGGNSYYLHIEITGDGGGTPPATVAVTGVSVQPTTLTLEAGQSGSLIATVAPSNATNQNVSWSSSNESVATVNNGVVSAVSEGTATITATTADGGFTSTCAVTVTPSTTPVVDVTGVSLSKYATTLNVGETETLTATVSPSNATNKTVTWSTSDASVATVNNGVITAVSAGTATITASSVADPTKTASCTVAVNAVPTPPVQTDLTLHEPEVYQAKEIAGGYGGTLRVISGREYEVYYPGKTNDSYASVCILPNTQKQEGITTNTSATSTKAKDGWFEAKIASISNCTLTENAEFEAATTNVMHKMANNNAYKFHVKGYDQFSILAKDKKIDTSTGHTKPQNDQLFEVYIDNVVQPRQSDASNITIRRFNMSTADHVIEVRALNGGNSELYGFSLRLAQEPRTKWLKGNDSTQVILQTTAPKPVYYFTKYNSLGETRLVWEGAEATGITLTTVGTSALGDTLVLSGAANCPFGTYNYRVASYFNGTETSSVSGKITVKSEIKATTDTIISVRQNTTMKEIRYTYYAIDASAIHLTWTGQTPTGISGSGQNGKYIISGTPTTKGEFPFTVCIDGGNCIQGKITVKDADLGAHPVMFLCGKEINADKDVVYKYLKSKNVNLDPLEAVSAPRAQTEYAPYDWILISEDVDANNPEILSIINGGTASDKPVLNLQGFTYWEGRLNWGNTVNGSVDLTSKHNNCKIFVQRDDHPIFKSWKGKDQAIEILQFEAGKQGFMPIEITNNSLQQSFCLATAYTRNIEDYYADGELQTVLHEIPASVRGGAKYICLPLASNATLTNDGKNLIDKVVNYLKSSTPADITVPQLEIKQFSINGQNGVIDPIGDTIKVTFVDQEIDMTALKPSITLADTKYSFVSPASGETVDFSVSTYKPVDFVVSDYISRRVYHVVAANKSSQGIEQIYEAGQWVNIFDIYGRKVATTNENIYTMDLPRGMYIVVTEGGQTLKIMR